MDHTCQQVFVCPRCPALFMGFPGGRWSAECDDEGAARRRSGVGACGGTVGLPKSQSLAGPRPLPTCRSMSGAPGGGIS